MNKRTFLVSSLVTLTLVALCIFLWRGPTVAPRPQTVQKRIPSPQPPATLTPQTNAPPTSIPDIKGAHLANKDKEDLSKIVKVFSAPIDFYGKVVDQNKFPIAGARVHYSAADQYFGDSSKYEGTSDANGFFFINGIKGAGLYVEVSKDGYDRIPNQSYSSFGYGVPSGKQAPTKDNPAVFILRKKAEAEPLIAVDRDVVVPKDGTPVDVSLKTGKPAPAGQGDLKIECWANDQNKDNQRRYEWHFRLSTPYDGGLTERRNTNFDFQAPIGGYQSFEEFQMPQAAERWRDSFEKDYFVKLSDGTYARMRFRITTGDHFASITAYVNPTAGDRNLEFDPKKEIKGQ